MMRLSFIRDKLQDVRIVNFRDTEIYGITPDSRLVTRGKIFAAIHGKREDGSRYIRDAAANGAVAFVLNNEKEFCGLNNLILSKNARKTLAEISSILNKEPQNKIKCIGITGTKGKTTTAAFLSGILKSEERLYLSLGSNGADGVFTDSFVNTTPDASILFPLLSRAIKSKAEFAVLEMSSQALRDYRVFGINTATAIFTGIGNDHVDKLEHKNFREYLNAKRLLFTGHGVKNAIVNSDDKYSDHIANGVKNIIRCGVCKKSDYRITELKSNIDGCDFFLNETHVTLSMPGAFNAKNASYALVAASLILGKPIKALADDLKEIRVPGRYERFFINGINVVVDYAHNEDSFRSVISLAKELYRGRIICVFGSVGGRSIARRENLALVAEELADLSVITADDPGYESAEKICSDIYCNFLDKSKATVLADREEAIRYAFSMASPGDCVLILGKGADRYMRIGGEFLEYSDISVVKSLI